MACNRYPYPSRFTACAPWRNRGTWGSRSRHSARAYPCEHYRRRHLTSKKDAGRKLPEWERRQVSLPAP